MSSVFVKDQIEEKILIPSNCNSKPAVLGADKICMGAKNLSKSILVDK